MVDKVPKKESAKRGYMTNVDVRYHLYDKIPFKKNPTLAESKEHIARTIAHIDKLLGRKLMASKTRQALMENLTEELRLQESGDRLYDGRDDATPTVYFEILRNHLTEKDLLIPENFRAVEEYFNSNRAEWEKFRDGWRLEGIMDSMRKRIKRNPYEGNLLYRVSPVIAIAGVLGGIFFLSSNITGNAIGNITNSTSSVIGACLLIVGLIAGFFWIKAKKKK